MLYLRIAGAQHTTEQRQTEWCTSRRQGAHVEELISITASNVNSLLQEINLSSSTQNEHRLIIEGLKDIQNKSQCVGDQQFQYLIMLINRNEKQQLQQQSNRSRCIEDQSHYIDILIEQNKNQQEQQQNQSRHIENQFRQIEVLIKQSENQQEQRNQSLQILQEENKNHQAQQQNQSLQIEVLIKQNQKQQKQQKQQNEQLSNQSVQFQLILQQIQVHRTEEQNKHQSRYENLTLSFNEEQKNQQLRYENLARMLNYTILLLQNEGMMLISDIYIFINIFVHYKIIFTEIYNTGCR